MSGLAEVLTIAQLAKRAGVQRSTMWRRLLRMKASSGGTWMTRRGRHWAVNVDRLKVECPEFAVPPTEAERYEDHERRLHALETLVLELTQPARRMAHRRRVRT